MVMQCLKKYKSIIFVLIVFILHACSSVIPSNYLSNGSINRPIKINGRWEPQRVIPISADMLNSVTGQALLAPAMQPQPYRIGPYDNLNIIVWGHPELSTIATAASVPETGSLAAAMVSTGANAPVVVQSDGKIFYPYVGNLMVANLTIDEIQQKIVSRLSSYLRNPQVSVQVAKYRTRNVFVLGEVVSPGLQHLTDKPLSLMEAISDAGGINLSSADPSHIYLIRGSFQHPEIFMLDGTTPQALMIAQQFPLSDNDIVYVSSAALSGVNRVLNQIVPTVTSYQLARGLANQ